MATSAETCILGVTVGQSINDKIGCTV